MRLKAKCAQYTKLDYTEAKKKKSILVDGTKHGVLSIYSKFRL